MAGPEGAEGAEGAVIAGTMMGGFRIGAPAANTPAGADSTVIMVVTAKESRRHIEVLPAGVILRTIVVKTSPFNR